MTYAILDVETSGISPDRHCILELGAIITDDNFKELERFSSFVKPWEGAEIQEQALAINKIKKEDFENAATETEVFNSLSKILRKYSPPSYAGFNVQFDLSFLKSLCFRNKLHLYGDGTIFDAQVGANNILGIRKYSLKSTAECLGLSPGDHRAMKDCETTLAIIKKIFGV